MNNSAEDLIGSYLDGTISQEEMAELQEHLRHDSKVRDRFLSMLRVDGLLREVASRPDTAISRLSSSHRKPIISLTAWALGCLLAIIGVILWLLPSSPTIPVANVGEVRSAKWLSTPLAPGERLTSGHEIKLASGSIDIHFDTGAFASIHGPAHFEIGPANHAFLHYGKAYAEADTETSEGFTIQTHAGEFVDRGTRFLATASPDGFSQVHVTSGMVDVKTPGFAHRSVTDGGGIGIESGQIPVMIQIEPGLSTPDFSFPNLPPPSQTDYASLHSDTVDMRLVTSEKSRRPGGIHPNSGNTEVLFDGDGQTSHDRPYESVFFDNSIHGHFLLNLGKSIPISRIHTYSWHRNADNPQETLRAVQRYTLWGSNAKAAPQFPSPEWTRIARVDTDAFFDVKAEQIPDRPTQQACAIFSNGGSLGNYRHLLFEVLPTSNFDGHLVHHTFFGEIDIFEATSE